MDFDATTQLVLATAALIGAVAFGVRWTLRYVKQINTKLEAELRADIIEKSQGWKRACADLETAQRDIAALKTSGLQKDEEIRKLKFQIDTLTKAIDTMHANYDKEKTQRKNGEARIEELQALLAKRQKLNDELLETNNQLKIETKTYQSALMLVGERLTENTPQEATE